MPEIRYGLAVAVLSIAVLGCTTSEPTSIPNPGGAAVLVEADESHVSLDLLIPDGPDHVQGDMPEAPSVATNNETNDSHALQSATVTAAETPQPAQPPDTRIEVVPASFVLEAVHTVEVTGAGLASGDELIIVGCRLPGEAIEPGTSAEDLVERVSDIDPATACSLETLMTTVVGDDGSFAVALEVDVGPATIVLAGPADGTYAVFTPVYLGA